MKFTHGRMKFGRVGRILACLFVAAAMSGARTTAAREFVNPIGGGQDPWVVMHNGRYLWCFSEADRNLSVGVSDRLTSLGERHIVWRAPDKGPVSRQIWAPELHLLGGRWHIYFAASDGKNENHLAYVLRSAGGDPRGPYALHGPLATGDGPDGASPNVWAIDMTVLEHGSRRYAIWSGWDAPGTDRQFLYIAPMSDPLTIAAPRTRICANDDHVWERTEGKIESRGLNEGPQVVKRAGRTFLIYSCGASWLRTYKYGLLELTGTDPLNPGSWAKPPEPVFRSAGETIGVGHGSFVPSPDGREMWHAYHAKPDPKPGWRRAVFLQPLDFRADGFPIFGTPVQAGEPLPWPSGQTSTSPVLPFHTTLAARDGLKGFSYYGHAQYLTQDDEGVILGGVPRNPVNVYRSGEKLVLNDGSFGDLEMSVRIRAMDGAGDAGLLFRVRRPAVGHDAQEGYFAGILPNENRVVLGRTDGRAWTELARAERPIPVGVDLRLTVCARGDDLRIFLDDAEVLAARDAAIPYGSVGLRVVNAQAKFRDLRVSIPGGGAFLKPAPDRAANP